jgi:hypothetical protein
MFAHGELSPSSDPRWYEQVEIPLTDTDSTRAYSMSEKAIYLGSLLFISSCYVWPVESLGDALWEEGLSLGNWASPTFDST